MGVPCLHVTVLATLLVRTNAQDCGPIQGISRRRLLHHVFRVITDSERFKCFRECGIEKKCQSHNFLYDKNICELNNRTKKARPDDLVYSHSAYYMDRGDPVPLGSIPELPGNTCKEIKLGSPGSKTGRYWIDPDNSNRPLHVVCNMTLEDVDECVSGTHQCPANSICTNTKGSYDCSCPLVLKWTGTNCTDRWVKLNGIKTVCFEGSQDRPGIFTPVPCGNLVAVKLVHRNGKIRCKDGAQYDSNWGCNLEGLGSSTLNIFVTNDTNKVVFLLTGYNWSGDPHFKRLRWYGIDGFNSLSPSLVLQRGIDDPYYISYQSTLRVWYGEDLIDKREDNNSGRICADVYGYFI